MRLVFTGALACAPSLQAANPDVLASAADVLRESYVFPEIGTKMAGLLDARVADGTYAALSGTALADRLTADLQAICHDKHLRVRFEGEGAAAAAAPSKYPRGRPEDVGIPESARRIDGVGYLRIDRFLPLWQAQARIDAAMTALAGSRALIVDLRENAGGNADTVAEVTGWLFDRSVHLNDVHWRVDWFGTRDTVDASYSTPKSTSTLTHVPVYVLISSKTFSAGEEFAYNLQQLGRATIIGETSAGGAHPVRFVALGDSFRMVVPSARSVNPVSGTNWERVGVKPDVPVAAADAMLRALAMAGTAQRASRNAGPGRMFPGLAN